MEEKQKRIEFLEKKVQTKDEVLAELMAGYVALKKSWGTLTGIWVPHDVQDLVVDFVRPWSEKAEIGVGQFIPWLGVTASKFYDWRQRYGCVNEHNGWGFPAISGWSRGKEAIIGFHLQNPLEGYRRLTFAVLDADVVAVSPASVWRVLKQGGIAISVEETTLTQGEWFPSSRCSRASTGISMFPISTCAAPSITCAVFWTGSAVSSCIRICVSR